MEPRQQSVPEYFNEISDPLAEYMGILYTALRSHDKNITELFYPANGRVFYNYAETFISSEAQTHLTEMIDKIISNHQLANDFHERYQSWNPVFHELKDKEYNAKVLEKFKKNFTDHFYQILARNPAWQNILQTLKNQDVNVTNFTNQIAGAFIFKVASKYTLDNQILVEDDAKKKYKNFVSINNQISNFEECMQSVAATADQFLNEQVSACFKNFDPKTKDGNVSLLVGLKDICNSYCYIHFKGSDEMLVQKIVAKYNDLERSNDPRLNAMSEQISLFLKQTLNPDKQKLYDRAYSGVQPKEQKIMDTPEGGVQKKERSKHHLNPLFKEKPATRNAGEPTPPNSPPKSGKKIS